MECLLAIKPLLVSMEITGLYYELAVSRTSSDITKRVSGEENNLGDVDRGPKRSKSFRGSQKYCFVVCFLLWFHVLRYILSFWVGLDYEEGITARRIIALSWALQCAINATVIYRGCRNPQQLPEFVKLLSDHVTNNTHSILSAHKNRFLRRKAIIITALCWTFVVLNYLALVVFFLNIVEGSEVFITVVTMPFGKSIVSQVLNSIFSVHIYMAWVFPIGFSCMLCTLLHLHFQALTHAIQVSLSTSSSALLRDLATFRRQHLRLCACVRVLDVVLRRLIMASYVTNIPLICFLLYQLVNSSTDVFSVVSYIFWLFINALCVVMISLYSAIVHEEAHSALDALFEVPTSGADPDQIVELQLFLSKLTGPSIGFTVLGIITVTKETILTLGGILTTYFFLLLQYQIH